MGISTTPELRIDPTSAVALHEQVAGAIRRAIADGEAVPGERLPPARDLAAVLGVNTNTVLRALHTLRDEGLLDFRRGRGVTVAQGAQAAARCTARCASFVALASRHGYRTDELVQMITDSQ